MSVQVWVTRDGQRVEMWRERGRLRVQVEPYMRWLYRCLEAQARDAGRAFQTRAKEGSR